MLPLVVHVMGLVGSGEDIGTITIPNKFLNKIIMVLIDC